MGLFELFFHHDAKLFDLPTQVLPPLELLDDLKLLLLPHLVDPFLELQGQLSLVLLAPLLPGLLPQDVVVVGFLLLLVSLGLAQSVLPVDVVQAVLKLLLDGTVALQLVLAGLLFELAVQAIGLLVEEVVLLELLELLEGLGRLGLRQDAGRLLRRPGGVRNGPISGQPLVLGWRRPLPMSWEG